MNKLYHSEWKPSVFAITTMIGTFIGIYLVQWELNLRFAFMYLIVVLVILLGNAIYVVYKRKKNSELGNEN